jgi:FlaA1/EpsC-like NDP-sugar epimerase
MMSLLRESLAQPPGGAHPLKRTDVFEQVRQSARISNWMLVAFDAAIVIVMTVLAYYARFEGVIPSFFERWIPVLAAGGAAVYLTLFGLFGLYQIVLRYVGLDALLRLSAAAAIGFAVLMGANVLMPMENNMRPVPLGVLFFQAVLVFMGASGSRLAVRVALHLHAGRGGDRMRVLIVGAGSAGPLLLREIKSHPDLAMSVVGFLDDDTSVRGRTIDGVPVLGGTADLARTVATLDVSEVIIAMPSAPRDTVRRILNAAADAHVQTRVMPQLVVARGSVSLRDLRSVDVEDLLGREPTPIDTEHVAATIAGSVVAVTGAAGSIGSELCRQVAGLGPERLVLIDVDESRLYELSLEIEALAPGISRIAICDIRDDERLDTVFGAEKPALVLHAAAYKHVPLMELAPAEAIKTNIGGTRSVIAACERHGVQRFVLISTDKAVAPVNVMGLTKSIAELVMLDAARRGTLEVMAVRFGNVLASRGSVVPIFEEQLRHGGPLTVTHEDVTRYFMTIPEAARLVLQAQAIGESGDIFVLEMGEPVRIVDLARKMIALSGVPAEIEFTGLRPGEKLHESLIGEHESLLPTDRQNILRVDRVDLPHQSFAEEIDVLVAAARRDDRAAIDAAIAHIDPDYTQRATPR